MSELRERIEALPGTGPLLAALDGLPLVYLVGGAVRDLLRGAAAVDLDLAVEGDARAAARTLAERLGGEAVEHERFGTATVKAPALELDLASTRREHYAHPGALPEVEPASLADDLGRRDFTINAMAVGLSPEDLGVLHDPHGGRDDLAAGVVRVMHDRSFIDDPTRLLRAVRYAARLGGQLDDRTEALAREAIAAGAPATVSGDRIRDELIDLLNETEVARGVELMGELRLDRALGLVADPDRAASAALAASETGAERALVALAALIADADAVERLALPRGPRDAVLRAAAAAPRLARELGRALPSSRIHQLLHGEPPEALALALALGAPGEPILRYLGELRGVHLEVTGDDLIAAGVPRSPELGRALEETLLAKLDGEVSGKEQELELALFLARAAGSRQPAGGGNDD